LGMWVALKCDEERTGSEALKEVRLLLLDRMAI
jgi:hypothetical protein